MNCKNKFQKLLPFDSKQDKIEHDATMLMFKFLSIVEEEMEKRGMAKKELAIKLGTSASYITQVFRGHKTINLQKLAEL